MALCRAQRLSALPEKREVGSRCLGYRVIICLQTSQAPSGDFSWPPAPWGFFFFPLRNFDKQSYLLFLVNIEACHVLCLNQSSSLTVPILLGRGPTRARTGGGAKEGCWGGGPRRFPGGGPRDRGARGCGAVSWGELSREVLFALPGRGHHLPSSPLCGSNSRGPVAALSVKGMISGKGQEAGAKEESAGTFPGMRFSKNPRSALPVLETVSL